MNNGIVIIEFLAVVLLIYGFYREKDIIEFEDLLIRAISIKWKLFKKRRAAKK